MKLIIELESEPFTNIRQQHGPKTLLSLILLVIINGVVKQGSTENVRYCLPILSIRRTTFSHLTEK